MSCMQRMQRYMLSIITVIYHNISTVYRSNFHFDKIFAISS